MSQTGQQKLAAAGSQVLVLCEEGEEREGHILVLCIMSKGEVEDTQNNPVHWLEKSALAGGVKDSPRSALCTFARRTF